MSFYAYVIRSQTTGRYYVGHTENLQKRIFEHNHNRTTSIKHRGSWELYYSEVFETRSEASARERQIKRMKSRRYIEALVGASR